MHTVADQDRTKNPKNLNDSMCLCDSPNYLPTEGGDASDQRATSMSRSKTGEGDASSNLVSGSARTQAFATIRGGRASRYSSVWARSQRPVNHSSDRDARNARRNSRSFGRPLASFERNSFSSWPTCTVDPATSNSAESLDKAA